MSQSCPTCRGKTKSVGEETIAALIPLRASKNNDGFRFCPSSSCHVVYTQPEGGAAIMAAALDVEVFQKSDDPDRLVCYCFDYSVRQVQQDAEPIIADIQTKCRAGLDRCEELNPQGRCCLGNVRQVANQRPASEAEAVGRWATGGAVVAAVLSSACCWLPLSLIALGIGAGSVGAFFETYRLLFLGITSVLLAAGFYYVYQRKPVCAPGDACAVPNPKLQRFNKTMLWVATVFVAAFALFPNYIGHLLGGAEQPTAMAAAPAASVRMYDIVGMTCEGCTVSIKEALERVPGVASAAIVYDDKSARVTLEPGAELDDATIIAAIDEAGFEATVRTPGQD